VLMPGDDAAGQGRDRGDHTMVVAGHRCRADPPEAGCPAAPTSCKSNE
jgi:hypothetical protein